MSCRISGPGLEANIRDWPYSDEWQRIKKSPAYKDYTSISRLEALVPWIFAVIYAVLLITPLIFGGATNPSAPPNP